jgi:hypothetical protein
MYYFLLFCLSSFLGRLKNKVEFAELSVQELVRKIERRSISSRVRIVLQHTEKINLVSTNNYK